MGRSTSRNYDRRGQALSPEGLSNTFTMRTREQPSLALLHDAEHSVRTALVYGNLLAGRFALQRTSGRRVAAVTASELVRVLAAARELTAAVDGVLGAAAPQLAADATTIAREACRREMAVPWAPLQPLRHLSLIPCDGGPPARASGVSPVGS